MLEGGILFIPGQLPLSQYWNGVLFTLIFTNEDTGVEGDGGTRIGPRGPAEVLMEVST